jgi:hypothetical protein
MPIATRLTSTGTLLVNGTIDEVTFNPTSGVKKNIISSSNTFDNTGYWQQVASTPIPNSITAPDGTNTAYFLRESATLNNGHLLQAIPTWQSGNRYTYSIYAKASTKIYLFLLIGSGAIPGQQNATFNLSTGATSGVNTGNGTTAAMTSVGNGWWRCSITTPAATSSGTSTIWAGLIDATGTTINYTGDGTSGIYIWGAQVEPGSIATIYQGISAAGALVTSNISTRTTVDSVYASGTFDEVTGMVVTNGMIAYIDAGKPESYPGTGTTIRDLVNPSTNTATLNGAIGWVNAGPASYWNFASATDTAYITSLLAQNYLDCTLVFYPDLTYVGGASLAYTLGTGVNTDRALRFSNANGAGPWQLRNPGDGNDWALVGSPTTFYVNNTAYTGAGNLPSGWNILGGLRTNTASGAFAANFAYTWGSGYPSRYFMGRLAAIVLYNRQLTAAEQQNNYNYFANRYGLTTVTKPPIKRESTDGTLYLNGSVDEWTGAPVVDSNLTMWVDFGQTSSYTGAGSTVYDLSPTRTANVTLTGSPTFNSIDGGGSGAFNGSTQYGTGAGTPLGLSAYTKSFWFKLTSYSSNNIVSSGVGGHFCFFGGSNRLSIGHGFWSNYGAFTSVATFNLNTWYHVCVTFNTATGMALYINGVLDSTYVSITTNPTNTPVTGSGQVDIASYGQSNFLTGSIGQVMIYNRALSADEALTNFNALRNRYGI